MANPRLKACAPRKGTPPASKWRSNIIRSQSLLKGPRLSVVNDNHRF